MLHKNTSLDVCCLGGVKDTFGVSTTVVSGSMNITPVKRFLITALIKYYINNCLYPKLYLGYSLVNINIYPISEGNISNFKPQLINQCTVCFNCDVCVQELRAFPTETEHY